MSEPGHNSGDDRACPLVVRGLERVLMSDTSLRNRDMIAILRSACATAGTQAAWAAKHGFSPAYVSDVLNGRRDMSEALANALGFLREVRFVPFKVGKVA